MKNLLVVAALLSLALPLRADEGLDKAADQSSAAAVAEHMEAAGEAAAQAFGNGPILASRPIMAVQASDGIKSRAEVLTHTRGEWNAKQKGRKGFVNGYNKGFAATLTPAEKVVGLGISRGRHFSAPNSFFLLAAAAAIVVGLILLVPAVLVGAGRGAYGAVAGERPY